MHALACPPCVAVESSKYYQTPSLLAVFLRGKIYELSIGNLNEDVALPVWKASPPHRVVGHVLDFLELTKTLRDYGTLRLEPPAHSSGYYVFPTGN